MRLEVVNGLVSFIGKPSESAKIEKALVKMAEAMEMEHIHYFGDLEDDYQIDYGIAYDMRDFTVEDIKSIWRGIK